MTDFNTLYLQRVLGYSPLEAGLAFLPFTGGIIIGAGCRRPSWRGSAPASCR